MDYKKLIIEALETDDWDSIMQYASKAKEGNSFLGLKKGCINIFTSTWRIRECLKEIGCTIIYVYDKQDVNELVKNGDLSHEIMNNKIIVTDSPRSTGLARLTTLGYPAQIFSVSETNKNKYDKKTGDLISTDTFIAITNKSTGEKIKFKIDTKKGVDKGLFKGFLREKNIDAIFSDD